MEIPYLQDYHLVEDRPLAGEPLKAPPPGTEVNPANLEPIETPRTDKGFVPLEEKYGGLSGMASAAGYGLARGATLNLSDPALTATGAETAQRLRGFEDVNPATSLISELLGFVGGSFVGVPLLSLGAKGVGAAGGLAEKAAISMLPKATTGIGRVGTTIAGDMARYGAESGLLTASGQISDAALERHELWSQESVANIGYGTLMGAGLGLVIGGVRAPFKESKFMADLSAKAEQRPPTEPPPPGAGTPMMEAPKDEWGQPLRSVKDMRERTAKAEADGTAIDLPLHKEAQEAAASVELKDPVPQPVIDSLANEEARKTLRMQAEDNPALDEYMNAVNKPQLREAGDASLRDATPDRKNPIKDPVESGNWIKKTLKKNYETVKEKLVPTFEFLRGFTKDIQTNEMGLTMEAILKRWPRMSEAIAEVESDAFGPGRISYQMTDKYLERFGVQADTFKAIKGIFNSLQKPISIQGLWDIRKKVDGVLDLAMGGRREAEAELKALKAILMDQIEFRAKMLIVDKEAGRNTPLSQFAKDRIFSLKDSFASFKKNEAIREELEHHFGIDLENKPGQLHDQPSETVLNRFFKDTQRAKALRDYLGIPDFNRARAAWVATAREEAVDALGKHDPAKFGKWLKRNEPVLNESFSIDPDRLLKIKHVNTLERITEPLTKARGAKKGFLRNIEEKGPWGAAKGLIGDAVHAFRSDYEFNEFLTKQQKLAASESLMEKSKKAAEKAIKHGVRAIIETGSAIGKIGKSADEAKILQKGIGMVMSSDEYDTKTQDILKVTNNPQAHLEALSKSTEAIHESMPQTASAIQKTLYNATQFLASKIPQKPTPGLFTKEMENSLHDRALFSRYYNTVNNPIGILHDIKMGTLTKESIETMKIVYAPLYKHLVNELMDGFTSLKDTSKVPYHIKMSLSQFMGSVLVPSLDPATVMRNQSIYNPPDQMMPQGKAPKSGKSKLDISGRTGIRRPGED